jgi:hypothetical protein
MTKLGSSGGSIWKAKLEKWWQSSPFGEKYPSGFTDLPSFETIIYKKYWGRNWNHVTLVCPTWFLTFMLKRRPSCGLNEMSSSSREAPKTGSLLWELIRRSQLPQTHTIKLGEWTVPPGEYISNNIHTYFINLGLCLLTNSRKGKFTSLICFRQNSIE